MKSVALMIVMVVPLVMMGQEIEYKGLAYGGTYLMAVICKDGIVMGSDSRMSFFNDKHELIAYFEGSKKVYQFRNIVFGIAGQAGFISTTFDVIFDKFTKTHNADIQVDKFYDIFLRFAKSTVRDSIYLALKQNQFLVCGYNNKQPFVYLYDVLGNEVISSHGYLTNFKRDNHNPQVEQIFATADLSTTVDHLDKYIMFIAQDRNKNAVSEIGGDRYIKCLTKEAIKDCSLPPKHNFKSVRELALAVKNKKVNMWYRSKPDSISINKQLQWFLP